MKYHETIHMEPGGGEVHQTVTLTSDLLEVRPWTDEVLDRKGFDPRSSYVEKYWLGVLGPSTTWLLRRFASHFDASPDGFELPLAETARALGLGERSGRNAPFIRSINRIVNFDLAKPLADDQLLVRRRLPQLSRRHLMRLSESQQAEHQIWQEQHSEDPSVDQQRRRSRQLALSLVELGEDQEAAERQLLRWRYHPALAREAVSWAWRAHQSALAAAAG